MLDKKRVAGLKIEELREKHSQYNLDNCTTLLYMWYQELSERSNMKNDPYIRRLLKRTRDLLNKADGFDLE